MQTNHAFDNRINRITRITRINRITRITRINRINRITRITRMLGVNTPIVQAPMGWIARSAPASA